MQLRLAEENFMLEEESLQQEVIFLQRGRDVCLISPPDSDRITSLALHAVSEDVCGWCRLKTRIEHQQPSQIRKLGDILIFTFPLYLGTWKFDHVKYGSCKNLPEGANRRLYRKTVWLREKIPEFDTEFLFWSLTRGLHRSLHLSEL